MQHFIIFLKYTGSWMLGLLVSIAASVAADGYMLQSSLYDTSVILAGQSNPWALPEATEESGNFRRLQKDQVRPYRYEKQPVDKFITPETLESLKRQQTQTQMMPGQQRNNRLLQKKYLPQQPESRLPWQGYYGMPSYGMGLMNPLYDTPALSPWGSAPDLVYRGDSLPGSFPGMNPGANPWASPWVPGEAMGGLPPIHIPTYNGSSNSNDFTDEAINSDDETNNSQQQMYNDVFNPFTFIPDKSW